MATFNLKGKLVEKYNEQKVTGSFRKREFVVEEKTSGGDGKMYIESIKFQLVQDKCDLLDKVNINDDVEVSFNLRGKRYEKDGKVNYFTNLDAWQITATRNTTSAPITSNNSTPTDDLPF
mgnify:CR=1 FL=1